CQEARGPEASSDGGISRVTVGGYRIGDSRGAREIVSSQARTALLVTKMVGSEDSRTGAKLLRGRGVTPYATQAPGVSMTRRPGFLFLLLIVPAAAIASDRAPDDVPDALAVGEDEKLTFAVHAIGVQIYDCTESSGTY